MSTVADKLTALHGIKADLFAATAEKGLDTTGRTLENLHELWGGISGGGALQAKTAVPSNVDVEVTPDDGYAALSAVNIAAALNLKPWNIRKGKTLFGVTGTADIAVTTEVPSDIPVSKDDADTEYEEAVGEAPKDEDGNDLDMMTLADDNGNITYGYFLQGAANGIATGTCLYNGVELPALPAISSNYKYAIISKYDNGSVDLYFTDTKATVGLSRSGTDVLVITRPGGVLCTSYKLGNGNWNKKYADQVNGEVTSYCWPYALLWANYDVLNESDGSVYLAASEPIPVVVNYNTIIRWDGNTEGLVSDSRGQLYKVSDAILSKGEMVGSYLEVSGGGTPNIQQIVTADMVVELDDGAVLIRDMDIVVSVPKNNYAIGDVTFPEAGLYFLLFYGIYPCIFAYNSASPSGFTITRYDPATTDFSAVGWRRLSYHTTGELAGKWTYDDFSTTPSTGGNYLKNIIQCSREKLYYNGVEVWPNPEQSAITAEEVTT